MTIRGGSAYNVPGGSVSNKAMDDKAAVARECLIQACLLLFRFAMTTTGDDGERARRQQKWSDEVKVVTAAAGRGQQANSDDN
ncbi:unnamed protein product [Nippostrongylus brasiliensis]|uniref:Uncharacterized protein n=1 Tax=Nippostrongylus brasiliensis TaxID=27835 RepID=A0A0N4Y6D7_NIPBR|nr:unnamed protein product [Nippostrongylus brasiliensis]